MTLYYLSAAKIPDKRAISIQQVRMCEAFANAGISTILVHPRYATSPAEISTVTVQSFYGVNQSFRIVRIPSLMGIRMYHKWIPKGFGTVSMIASLSIYLLAKIIKHELGSGDFVYARNIYAVHILLLMLKFLPACNRPKVGIELHRIDEASNSLLKKVIPRTDLIVCITSQLKSDISRIHRIIPDRIFVEPDGVDIDMFDPEKQESGKLPYIPPAGYKGVAIYAGHLYENRGVETIIDCAKMLPDFFFLIVGGYDKDIARIKSILTENAKNIHLAGFVAPAIVGKYLAIADVLLAPYTSKDHLILYRSPLKLFEYMAAHKPIVASDHKILREILDDDSAYFIREQDPFSMKNAILHLLANPAHANHLADNAFKAVQQYSWSERAKHILSYFKAASATA